MGHRIPGLDPHPLKHSALFRHQVLSATPSRIHVLAPTSFRIPPAHQRGSWVGLGAPEASGQAHLPAEAGKDHLRG